MSDDWLLFTAVTGTLAIAYAITAVSIRVGRWLAARNAAEDRDYAAMRTPGMGEVHLDPDAPVDSELADLRPDVVASLDAARLRRSR